MLLDDITEEEGYVIAVSEEPETAQEMYDIRAEYPIGTLFFIGGAYGDLATIIVQD